MAKQKKACGQQDRKWWFKLLKKLMKGRYKRPEFIYLGKKFDKSAIILSNHEGTDAPMTLELYCDQPIRFWGAHEMNSGLISMYKYQSQVYYHEKKHWNLFLARLFCLIASPLTNLFYKGLNLISTYRDVRFKRTVKESLEALQNGKNIVVFPEDSKNGYLPELEGFFQGFAMLAEICARKGMDVPIYVTYYKKKELQYIVDKPVMYSELTRNGATRAEIAKRLLDRCNQLGKMKFDRLDGETVTEESAIPEESLQRA